MAPANDDALADIFSCGICLDYFHDPITLVCCGKSFCQRCLRAKLQSNAQAGILPRCPAGCNQMLPYQLPCCTQALKESMEKLVPEEVTRRAQEEEEAAADEPATCCGGDFKPWQVVTTSVDLDIGPSHAVVVQQGTNGLIIGDACDGEHICVKFEKRLDDSELCINVPPNILMNALPGGFRLMQQVVANYDICADSVVKVRLGAVGQVCGPSFENHLQVHFFDNGERANVPIAVVSPLRLLVGGFSLGQKVQAGAHFEVGAAVIPVGCPGVVLREYSDTRLTVAFDLEGRGDLWTPEGRQRLKESELFNVLPVQVQAICDQEAR